MATSAICSSLLSQPFCRGSACSTHTALCREGTGLLTAGSEVNSPVSQPQQECADRSKDCTELPQHTLCAGTQPCTCMHLVQQLLQISMYAVGP